MSDFNESKANTDTPLQIFELALQKELTTGKNKKEADFNEAYPVIEQHLAKNVPQRIVLEMFNKAYGYTVHTPRFRKLLLDERKRRAEDGDVLVCPACGQKLVPDDYDTDHVNNGEEQ